MANGAGAHSFRRVRNRMIAAIIARLPALMFIRTGAAMTAELEDAGRYGEPAEVDERAGSGLFHRVRSPCKWQKHLHGFTCLAHGLDFRTRELRRIHERDMLARDDVTGRIGDDIDGIEGHLDEFGRRLESCEDQLELLTRLLGPFLARLADQVKGE